MMGGQDARAPDHFVKASEESNFPRDGPFGECELIANLKK